jgi:hypothetical protein
MNDVMKDVMGIALAVIGLATLTVLVRPGSQTGQLITSATTGFSKVLNTAMGGR